MSDITHLNAQDQQMLMKTVTIPKKEYSELLSIKRKYEDEIMLLVAEKLSAKKLKTVKWL